MMWSRLSSSLLLLALGMASADKDDSYYIAGTGNPNVNEAMYWKDSDNVLQDLSQFSTLYVEFHSCAWTWMQTDEADNDVDENDYWYMGKIPPMGANVAYSLYGAKKGHTFQGCRKDSFINSFYTSSGFDGFAKSMYYAGVSGFSQFSYSDDDSSSLSSKCQGGYGVGCDYKNGFAMHEYSSNECNPEKMTDVSNKMSNLNSAMSKAQCVKIYDSSTYSGYTEGTSMELLSNSNACLYQDVFSPDGECPDPFGKLAYYQSQFHKGITQSKKNNAYSVYVTRTAYVKDIKRGKLYTMIGSGLFLLSLIIFIVDRNPKKRPTKKSKPLSRSKKSFPTPRQEEATVGDDGSAYSAPMSDMENGSFVASSGAPPEANMKALIATLVSTQPEEKYQVELQKPLGLAPSPVVHPDVATEESETESVYLDQNIEDAMPDTVPSEHPRDTTKTYVHISTTTVSADIEDTAQEPPVQVQKETVVAAVVPKTENKTSLDETSPCLSNSIENGGVEQRKTSIPNTDDTATADSPAEKDNCFNSSLPDDSMVDDDIITILTNDDNVPELIVGQLGLTQEEDNFQSIPVNSLDVTSLSADSEDELPR